MVCNNCKKTIDDDSKFCHFCGAKLEKNDQDVDNYNSDSSDTAKSNKKIKLWDKFVEIYDSTSEERKTYQDLSSDEVWELIQRISNNKFEDFIQESKELLNKQPYKVIETLKNVFGWCASGGYWLWMPEALLKDKNLNKPNGIPLNHFIEEWQEIVGKKYTEYSKVFSDELTHSMSVFFEYELKTALNSADTVKDLPNEFVENLKTALMIQIIWGYLGGVAENKYRK